MDDHRLTSRDKQKLLTRARVMDAARTLFAEKGYEQATIRDIAALAGVAPGSVFTTFASKSDLLQEIVYARFMTLAEALSFPTPITDPIAQLTSIARLAYGYELQEQRLMAEIVGASWTWSKDAEFENRRRVVSFFNLIERVIRGGQEAGAIRSDTPAAMLAEMAVALYLQNLRKAIFDGEDASELTERYTRQIKVLLMPLNDAKPKGESG